MFEQHSQRPCPCPPPREITNFENRAILISTIASRLVEGILGKDRRAHEIRPSLGGQREMTCASSQRTKSLKSKLLMKKKKKKKKKKLQGGLLRRRGGIFYTPWRISRRYFGPGARRWVGRRGRGSLCRYFWSPGGKRSHAGDAGRGEAWRARRGGRTRRRVVRCSRGQKWRGVLMRFRYRPGHLVSRLYPLPSSPPPPPDPAGLPTAPDIPRIRPRPHDVDEHVRIGGGGGVDRGSKRGPPKGGVARRMGRYVCRERTTGRPPSWNRCRSSGRKELLRSSGAAGVYPPLACVCARLHIHPSAIPCAISRCRHG
jgi:hypothetical protein